ncbi:MAG TPA: TIGR02996 domain-containing protein, partial [Gemmata sp.]
MTTDEQRALWAAIWADPADDTARLVYADWLQEHGDEARAEFIQLQIEQTQLFSPSALCSDPNERTLTKRETRLISHHRERWLQPLSEIANQAGCDIQWSNSHKRVKFARGFPRDVALSLHAAYRVAARGADIEPLEELKITSGFISGDVLPFVATIAQWPHAACVTEISIPEVSDEVMRVLTGGQTTRLRTLDFEAGEMT